MVNRSATTRKETRLALDAYYTPTWMPRELIQRVPFHGVVLECCTGEGAIASVLHTLPNVQVITNDINPNVVADFHLDMTLEESWDVILEKTRMQGGINYVVSNLPFNAADEILPLAEAYANYGCSFLFRRSYLEPTMTGSRAGWLHTHPPVGSIILPRFAFSRSPKTDRWQTDSVTCEWVNWRKDGWRPSNPIDIVPHYLIDGFHRNPDADPSLV
jgi:hypothetical protein